MKIAAAAYPLERLPDWAAYDAKVSAWVADAAGQGADLLVFPEYGAMELASLGGAAVAADLEASLTEVARHTDAMAALFARVAAAHDVHVLAPSAPVAAGAGRPVNRAVLYGPHGMIGHQDKQIMTRFEREEWHIAPGAGLTLFDTALGRIGVLICYDAEFPLLARALVEAGAQILLVPSATDSYAGYTRVRVGAMARALENQCVVVQSPTVGAAAWCEAMDMNVGAAAIYGPPDHGFPEDGILAQTRLNLPGWAVAEVSLAAVEHVRRAGGVLNHLHWAEQPARLVHGVKHADGAVSA